MKKLGIIAGQGELPYKIYEYCYNNNIECYIVYINTENNPKIHAKKSVNYKIGEVGKILKFFQQNKCFDLALAGSLKKPNFNKIKIDFRGFLLMSKILRNKISGDNAILTTVINYLEKLGFNIIEIDKIVPDLHLNLGCNNKIKINKKIEENIILAKEIIHALSSYDIGQAIILQNKRVIGIEAVEGTDNLILRSKNLIEDDKKHPALLVKILKTNQDRRADLPTIGLNTIKNLVTANIKGIVIDVNNCLVMDKEEICKYSEEQGIFLYGI
jgi:DUF1009 family protein